MATTTDTGPRTPVVPPPARRAATPAAPTGPTPINAVTGGSGTGTYASPGYTPPAPAGAPGTPLALPGASTGETITSGTQAIQAILDLIGMGTAKGNDGSPLASSILTALNTSGLDPTNASESNATTAFIDTWLPSQTAYQTRFPGIMQQIASGQAPMSPTDYITLEDTMNGLATQYGFSPSVFSNPDVIAGMVTNNISATTMANRFSTYMDAYQSEPVEVQQAFNQFYGINGATAYAAQIANIGVSDDQLKQQAETAEIAGAGQQLGLAIDQPTATKLAGLGVSYATALSAASKTVAESGLYTQTMGEVNQTQGKGATNALTGEEAFDANTEAGTGAEDQALQQEKENREALFRGGGGASSTQSEGFVGIGAAKSS